jgi:hypothetical protein
MLDMLKGNTSVKSAMSTMDSISAMGPKEPMGTMGSNNKGVTGPIDRLVGPISEKYCYYFYILSVLAILFFVMVFAGIVYTALMSKQKFNPWHVFLLLVYSCQFLLIYLQNRLLYNMCIHSINE